MRELFVSNDDEYKRDINPFEGYIRLNAFYISKMTGKPIEEVKEWIRTKMKQENSPVLRVNPKIKYFTKEGGVDRHEAVTDLTTYLNSVIQRERVISPTGTVYKSVTEEPSLFTPYINSKRNERKVYKQRMFECERKGDKFGQAFNNELQGNTKIDVNTLSGAELSRGTIIHTQSAHPTLTSTGRIATSYANTINENLIRANRHYETYQITLDHLILLAETANTPLIEKCFSEYGLEAPTTAQVWALVSDSTSNYWKNYQQEQNLIAFIDKCTPAEKANIAYNGSLEAMCRFSPEVALSFINSLSEPVREPLLPLEEAQKVIKNTYDDLLVLGVYLCSEYTKGKTLQSCLEEGDYTTYGIVANTIVRLNENLNHWRYLIQAFFKLMHLPPNIYDIKAIYRKCVVTSDTDSTNFTTQEICRFVTGEYGLTQKDRSVNFLVTYLSSMMVYQALGIASINLGVDRNYVRELAMKNEYYTPIHNITPSAKNYIMVQAGKEGLMLKEPSIVTKGVELRSSKFPEMVLAAQERYKQQIYLSLYEGKKFTLRELLEIPYQTELEITSSISNFDTTYLFTTYIKTPDAYSAEEQAPAWRYHLMYEAVFAPKYGSSNELPYVAYLISVDLSTQHKMKAWIESIKDEAFKKRLINYLEANGITKLTKIAIPQNLFGGGKIPEEIRNVLFLDDSVVQSMSSFYLLLESYGIYLRNKYTTKMLTKIFKNFMERT